MKEKLTFVGLEILAFLAFFFADLYGSLLAIGFLIIADTFTGVWAAWNEGGRKAVTSEKGRRIVAKILLYPLSIIVAKVAQIYLSPAIPWVDVTSGILAVIEVKSIFENISLILGYDLWDRIKDQLSKRKGDIDADRKDK